MQAAADVYRSYCFQYMEFVASVKVNARGEEGFGGRGRGWECGGEGEGEGEGEGAAHEIDVIFFV
jgi:hypothetical protein